jgi:hypothetical protein
MRPSRETLIVAAICLLDLVSTLFLVQTQQASEGNAVMNYYLEQGVGAFIAAKCLLFVPALIIAEWYRRRNPRLVIRTLRVVIVLYLGFYSAVVYRANQDVFFVNAAFADTKAAPPPPGRPHPLPQ